MSTAVPSFTADEWRAKIASHFDSKPEYLIPILQHVQAEVGFLPPEAMLGAARFLRIPESKVYGVASFYAQFVFEPQGEHKITICRGTACHVKGSGNIENELCALLDVPVGGGTTHDLLFTVEIVACVGACALAPVVVVNGEVHAEQSVSSVTAQANQLREQSKQAAEDSETEAAEA